METTMTSTVFLKARSIALCCLVFVNMLWIISLCLVIFTRWDVLDRPQQSLMILMLVANTISAIVLLILLLLEFRPWLDAARVAFLLVVHIGIASAFAYWSPNLRCLTHTPDQEGVCRLIIIYLLIASWFIPILLITYASGLAIMVWKRSRLAPSSTPLKTAFTFDEETMIQQPSAVAVTNATTHRHPSRFTLSAQMSDSRTSKSSLISDDTENSRVSIGKRLSKPSPVAYF